MKWKCNFAQQPQHDLNTVRVYGYIRTLYVIYYHLMVAADKRYSQIRRKVNSFATFIVVLALLTSCSGPRDIVYFSNLKSGDLNQNQKIDNVVVPTIQPDDLLSITVNSLSVESNMLFNQGVLGTLGSNISNEGAMQQPVEGYLVDRQGHINFPVVGKIHLAGMSKAAATDTIQAILNRDYVKNPTVNIRFLNFRVTVLGEVRNPSTLIIPTEKVNIIEAISMAGDLTVVGKRENVLILREQDGIRNFLRVNLNDKSLVESPYYYLQQNDIIYIEPDSFKAAQASLGRTNAQFTLSIILSTLTIASLILSLR